MVRGLINTIFARRSIRKYTTEPVKTKDIRIILEAAMAAPSASNLKPWHFVVITDKQKLDNLSRAHPHGKMLLEAPLCIAVCGDKTISASFWVQDCSAATEKPSLSCNCVRFRCGLAWCSP